MTHFTFCEECRHIYKGEKCKICLEEKLCSKKVCHFCDVKTFSTHMRSNFLLSHPKGKVSLSSTKRLKFQCSLCYTQFRISPKDIIDHKKWCPSCFQKASSIIATHAAFKLDEVFTKMNKNFRIYLSDVNANLIYNPPFSQEDWSQECLIEENVFKFVIDQDYIISCDLSNNNEEWVIRLEQELLGVICLSDDFVNGFIRFIM